MSLPRNMKVSKSRPCPICGKPDWCVFLPGGDAVWCARRTSDRPHKAGWIHKLEGATPGPAATRPAPTPRERPDLGPLARRCHRSASESQLASLARQLCPEHADLYATALSRLQAGWITAADAEAASTPCRADGLWTFPMSDGCRRIVGIRVRTRDGRKFAVTGSDGAALFVPTGLPRDGQMLFPEGPTSAAALLACGYAAVGRPNNRAGAEHVARLIRETGCTRAVLVGDNDQKPDGTWPGLDGAREVAALVAHACRDVRVILPPAGVKDARDWLARDGPGVMRVSVAREIESAARQTVAT